MATINESVRGLVGSIHGLTVQVHGIAEAIGTASGATVPAPAPEPGTLPEALAGLAAELALAVGTVDGLAASLAALIGTPAERKPAAPINGTPTLVPVPATPEDDGDEDEPEDDGDEAARTTEPAPVNRVADYFPPVEAVEVPDPVGQGEREAALGTIEGTDGSALEGGELVGTGAAFQGPGSNGYHPEPVLDVESAEAGKRPRKRRGK